MSASARSRALPALVLVTTLVLGAIIAVGGESVARTLLTCAFLLVCPGLGLAPLIRLDDPVGTWTVAITLSVALDIIVAGGLMYAGAWSTTATFLVLAVIAATGAVVQLVTSTGRAPG